MANATGPDGEDEDRLLQRFEPIWPKLSDAIGEAARTPEIALRPAANTVDDKLDELLKVARDVSQSVARQQPPERCTCHAT